MFQGYTQETVDFLWGIRFNNERGWFMEHKQIYQTALLEPTRALGGQIYDGLHAMLPDEPLQLKVSRIYRDARRLFGRGRIRTIFGSASAPARMTGRPPHVLFRDRPRTTMATAWASGAPRPL